MKFSLISFLSFISLVISQEKECSNQCVSFTVGSGTGCEWMCNYCATTLGTSNYYFTDNVCSYESGVGCVGQPIAGKQYTCCSM